MLYSAMYWIFVAITVFCALIVLMLIADRLGLSKIEDGRNPSTWFEIFLITVVVVVLPAMAANWADSKRNKTPAEIAATAAAEKAATEQEKKDQLLATQQAEAESKAKAQEEAKEKGKKLFDEYNEFPKNFQSGVNESEFVDGELIGRGKVAGKYETHYGWIKIRYVFLDGIYVKEVTAKQPPEIKWVAITEYDDHKELLGAESKKGLLSTLKNLKGFSEE